MTEIKNESETKINNLQADNDDLKRNLDKATKKVNEQIITYTMAIMPGYFTYVLMIICFIIYNAKSTNSLFTWLKGIGTGIFNFVIIIINTVNAAQKALTNSVNEIVAWGICIFVILIVLGTFVTCIILAYKKKIKPHRLSFRIWSRENKGKERVAKRKSIQIQIPIVLFAVLVLLDSKIDNMQPIAYTVWFILSILLINLVSLKDKLEHKAQTTIND